MCSIPHHRDIGVVPLVGVYSTEAHPFSLIYEYMEGLDLRQYLRNEPRVERLQLVPIPMHLLYLLFTNPLMLLDNS